MHRFALHCVRGTQAWILSQAGHERFGEGIDPGYDRVPGKEARPMCRNIRTLANFEPPATDDEIRASALQFVRKISGFAHPSKANEAAFNRAVDEVAHIAHHLLEDLVVTSPPRDRAVEAAKAKARAAVRFG
jgi:hypothetical protein